MAHLRPRVFAWIARTACVPLVAVACASTHADGNSAPETSRHAADSAAASDAPLADSTPVDSDPGPASSPLAPRPTPPPPVARPAPLPTPRVAPSSPYRVELLGDSSNTLATFHRAGRTYVLGTLGSRYRIHVTNPTGRRVEAVVSVDGLDAIDGTTADYVHKSGYVIAPYGDLLIDGFRTSMAEVATFRFSSVPDSYAAREGSDRNVGVIGVAFFPERDAPPPVLPRPRPVTRHYPPAPAPPAPMPMGGGGESRGAADKSAAVDDVESAPPSATAAPAEPSRERAGLGTEFGEQRYSAVQYTEFQRANATHPSALAEIRYNDRSGLIALGIPLSPPAPSEVELRETASPFPANQFAKAPPPR